MPILLASRHQVRLVEFFLLLDYLARRIFQFRKLYHMFTFGKKPLPGFLLEGGGTTPKTIFSLWFVMKCPDRQRTPLPPTSLLLVVEGSVGPKIFFLFWYEMFQSKRRQLTPTSVVVVVGAVWSTFFSWFGIKCPYQFPALALRTCEHTFVLMKSLSLWSWRFMQNQEN